MMLRVGYIVVRHEHYDSTEQVPFDKPSKVYLDRDEAEAEARKLDSLSSTGYVWEIALP